MKKIMLKILNSIILFFPATAGSPAPAAPAPGGPAAPAPAAPAAPAAGTPPAAPAVPAAPAPGEPAPAGGGSDYQFTLPEGMTPDAGLLAAVTPIFKKGNLSQEHAQELVSAYAKQVQAQAESQTKAAQDSYEAEVANWEKAAKDDKDIGGAKFDETKQLAAAGLAKLGTPALAEFFDKYGIGSHPEVVRLMRRVGELVKEDQPGGGGPVAEQKSRAEILYGSDTK